ncbi:DegQ family serine endoprotease [Arhodomonas sp. SL1]|uniref:DegQ family serine endoprotease n=1 Tax=Arhodomonas sp. SL1 TaxID=3425691 RepID=UPI003F885E8D
MKTLLTTLAVGLTFATAQPALSALPDAGDDNGMPSLAPLVEEVSPAVVNISTRGTVEAQQNPLMEHPFFKRFFDEDMMPRREREVRSLGSGVIVDADEGYILTNHHVIDKADEITVGTNDNRQFTAEVIGSDPETDIAVIQIEADNLTQVTIGDSSTLRPGDYVVAVGNPFGLEHTVTSGIVSGLGRSLSGQAARARIQDFIQTDASINPGNSGGALVNLRGELVGINTAILSRSGGNIGIGFAVPVNMAKQIMDQLIEHGEVRRGVLGVRVQDLTPEIAEAMGMDDRQGALIAQVQPDSAAEEAGLQEGDVVTAVDGEAIDGAAELAKVIGLHQIGDTVELTIVRDGEERTIEARVGERSEETAATGGLSEGPLAGVELAELDERSPLHGEVEGVLVTGVSPDSPAARGLREGDVITSVNRRPVRSVADLEGIAQGQSQLLLRVRRGDSALFMVLRD